MPQRRKPSKSTGATKATATKSRPSRGARAHAPTTPVRRAVLATNGMGIASTRDVVATLSDEQARRLALDCRDAAEAKKAEGVLMLDIRDRAGFADYFILATGRSVIQVRSIADAVAEAGEERWGAPLRTEGYNDGTWILVDYGPVIVHVFTPQAREFYNLERLWGKPSPPKRKQG
jgi:ribosome-associated protein